MRRLIFGALATFGVTAAIAVPLLSQGSAAPDRRYRSVWVNLKRGMSVTHVYNVTQSFTALGHGGVLGTGTSTSRKTR